MKKYILRYLAFWAPAFFMAVLFHDDSLFSQALQWFTAFLMVFGWTVTTGMAAYHYPKKVLSLWLVYVGGSTLLITFLYSFQFGGRIDAALLILCGIFGYTPLTIFIEAILDFPVPHEIYVTGFLAVCCMVGYLCGINYRRRRPNPYRPRITR